MNKYLVDVFKFGEYKGTLGAKSLESAHSQWGRMYDSEGVEMRWRTTKEGWRITYLRELAVGDYFLKVNNKLKPGKTVYVRDDFDRSSNKYGYYKFHDVCDYKEARGNILVTDEMTF